MSKVKEKKIVPQKNLVEFDMKFEKILQFSGWMFLLSLAVFMGGWFFLDMILEIIDLTINDCDIKIKNIIIMNLIKLSILYLIYTICNIFIIIYIFI